MSVFQHKIKLRHCHAFSVRPTLCDKPMQKRAFIGRHLGFGQIWACKHMKSWGRVLENHHGRELCIIPYDNIYYIIIIYHVSCKENNLSGEYYTLQLVAKGEVNCEEAT